jgi:hypothetical protein
MVRRCIREGTFPGEARGEVGSVKIADFVLKQFLHSRTRAECRNPRMLKDAKNRKRQSNKQVPALLYPSARWHIDCRLFIAVSQGSGLQ